MSTSKEYWKRREYRNLLKSKNRDERFVKERIAYIYNELLRNINKEIQSQITRFSDSQGISINEARKMIEKADVEDYKYLAKTYVKDKDFSQKANREMKLYNITMRLNRLEMLNQMVRLHIIGTGSKVENELQDHLIKGSIDEYKRQASILGLNINRTGIERRARFIVSQDYHNSHFSDRVWRDTRELSRRIERNIESVVIQGKNPREFARKLRDLVSKDIKNITNATERLAYTESGRVWIQTQIEAYKDGGYEYLEIMTEPTACRHCSPHNGDIVKISEAVEGDNIPLWHPRCRCTTVAAFGEVKDLDYWEHDGEKYYVDDHHVILDYSEHEREVADLLAIKMNTTVNMVPKVVYPQDISTPDYLIDNKRWDLKDIYGKSKNTIDNAVLSKKKQASNFIFDISKTDLTFDQIDKQVKKLYLSERRKWIDDIKLVQNNRIIKEYYRKK
uniref:Minor capsid protein n=1 Tax=Firmicutes phage HS08 TaxID=3056391 RepID=A0AA49X2C6_9VIRU|nr:MAG: minor capsid protein [Firmicutes phage HS08]